MLRSLFILLLFPAFCDAQSADGLEKLAYSRVKWALYHTDTTVQYTSCDHHGNQIYHSRRVRIHTDAAHRLVYAEELFTDPARFCYYYFYNGLLIFYEATVNGNSGDIEQRSFPQPPGTECTYNDFGRFVEAVGKMGE